MRLILFVILLLLFANEALADDAKACTELLKAAFNEQAFYESIEEYNSAYSSMKSISNDIDTESKFKQEMKNRNMEGKYKVAKAAYSDSSGKSESETDHKELFQSLSEESFTEYARNSLTREEKKEFVVELTGAVEKCIEGNGYWLVGNVDLDPQTVKIKIIANGIGVRTVESITFSPKDIMECPTLKRA